MASLAAGALVWACSASTPTTPFDGSGGFSPTTTSGDGGAGAACAHFKLQAEAFPVNLYILFDKSSSMAGNKWDAAKAGLTAFVGDESSTGIRAGLRFFPRDPDNTAVCDQNAYAVPEVPFTSLPNGAATIVSALDAETPDGFSTPIYPALGGGILGGIAAAEDNPGERSAVLLVTDGTPQGPAATCGGVDPEDATVIANLAAIGASHKPPVPTYVVGLPGVDQSVANQIAAAGGTEQAILVGANDVENEFREALASVRGDALPCIYAVPEDVLIGNITINHVNVEITPSDGDPFTVLMDPACNGEGWRYDNPDQPTAIILCDDTCDALKSDSGAAIDVLLGCGTLLK